MIVTRFYAHEYGHTIQSKIWGPLYLLPALLSLGSAISNPKKHGDFWVEKDANAYSRDYFKSHFPDFVWDYENCMTSY